jgi:hypothetical protein
MYADSKNPYATRFREGELDPDGFTFASRADVDKGCKLEDIVTSVTALAAFML